MRGLVGEKQAHLFCSKNSWKMDGLPSCFWTRCEPFFGRTQPTAQIAVSMKPLEPPDSLHLQAAQGWLELGNPIEAEEELGKVPPQHQAHPAVLEVRWEICAKAKKWDAALEIASALVQVAPDHPLGWVHRSFCLHEAEPPAEARDNLLRVMDKFPEDSKAVVGVTVPLPFYPVWRLIKIVALRRIAHDLWMRQQQRDKVEVANRHLPQFPQSGKKGVKMLSAFEPGRVF